MTTISYIPSVCPKCNAPLKWKGTDLVCDNPDCSSKQFIDLLHWVMTIGAVDNIGATLVCKFLDELDVTSIDDIYSRDLISEFQTGGSQRSNFIKVLENLYTQPINIKTALVALNIPRLGWTSADKLSKNKEVTNALLDGIIIGSTSSIIGPATTNSISENCLKLKRLSYIKDRIFYPEESEVEIKGQVAITGALSVKRSEFENLLKDNGFTLGGISKNSLCLITDNPNSGSSKNKKADELGIPKLTEEEFRKKYFGE